MSDNYVVLNVRYTYGYMFSTVQCMYVCLVNVRSVHCTNYIYNIVIILYILQYIQYNMKGLLCWYMCLHTEISFLPGKSVFLFGKDGHVGKILI